MTVASVLKFGSNDVASATPIDLLSLPPFPGEALPDQFFSYLSTIREIDVHHWPAIAVAPLGFDPELLSLDHFLQSELGKPGHPPLFIALGAFAHFRGIHAADVDDTFSEKAHVLAVAFDGVPIDGGKGGANDQR